MDAFAQFLEYPGKWTALIIAANISYLLAWSFIDGRKLKDLIGYIGAFAIGFAIIEAFLKREGAQPLISCTMISDEVVNCNGWVSYSKSLSTAMFNLSEWYRENLGSSEQHIFALGVVTIIFHFEMAKTALGRGHDILKAFMITAFVLFIFNYSGAIVTAVNGLVDTVFSLNYSNQVAAVKKASQLISDMHRVEAAIDAKDFLSTAADTFGSGVGGFWTRFQISITTASLGLASIVNMILFALQSIILYALPSITLIALLIGNFSGARIFSYIVFSSLLRAAAMVQLHFFSSLGQSPTTEGGLELLHNASGIASTAIIAAAVGTLIGGKIILVLLIREALPVMSGTSFQIGKR